MSGIANIGLTEAGAFRIRDAISRADEGTITRNTLAALASAAIIVGASNIAHRAIPNGASIAWRERTRTLA